MEPDLQMSGRRYRLGFIGAGKLAGSVIRGLLRAKFCESGRIIASEPNDNLRTTLGAELGIDVTAENAEAAEKAEVLLLGVKPGVVLPVIRDAAEQLADKLVISLAAGVRLQNMESFSKARLMRAMTNTPTAICRGATAIAPGSRTTPDDLGQARTIFDAIGVTVEVGEEQIDAVTALAGSGPAFVYTMIEALAEGGKQRGLSSEAALRLATQTVLGAAQLASETGLSPEELRKMVITPGGTTAAGLAAMEKMKAPDAIAAAVVAATDRGREMAQEFSS
jgi:pyrroline-5-carboxylate reductase